MESLFDEGADASLEEFDVNFLFDEGADASLEEVDLDFLFDEGADASLEESDLDFLFDEGADAGLEESDLDFLFDEGADAGLEESDLDFLFDEGINDFGFLDLGDQFPLNQDAPLLEETRQTAVEVGGSQFETAADEKELETNMEVLETTREESTKLRSELEAANQKIEELESKSTDQINHGEECANKKELETVREESTKLRSELEAANQKIEELESKSTDQLNHGEECRIVLELDFPDEAAKRKIMKKAAGYRGITSFKMDTQRKRMFLEGTDIDPVRLKGKLDKVCNTKMIYFNIDRKAAKKKADDAIEFVNSYEDENPHIYPQHQEDPSQSAHESTSAPRFSFKNAVKIFFGVLLLLLLALMGKLLGILTDNIIYGVFEL